MARTWYPVIDYTLCTACGSCVTKCSHGVYNKAKAPVPVVEKAEACVDHCHGCGALCPAGAISYLGEDTGWVPPHGKPALPEAPCGCVCGTASTSADGGTGGCACEDGECGTKTVAIEYLYLDLTSCDRCIGTDQVLDEVVAAVSPALSLAGYQVQYRRLEMTTAETAVRHQFLTSPTIRVNGRDIAAAVAENHCGCCSAISGGDVDCRVFTFEGATYEVPPKRMLAYGILSAVFGGHPQHTPQEAYRLPDNLRRFYEGRIGNAQPTC